MDSTCGTCAIQACVVHVLSTSSSLTHANVVRVAKKRNVYRFFIR